MAKIETPIDAMRERLTQLLADWGAEMSMVLKELEEARGQLAEFESAAVGNDSELGELRQRVEKQQSLLETLKGDAAEAGELRKSLHAADLDVEKLRSELKSKGDLITVLRKDAEKADALKQSLEKAEAELQALRRTNADLEGRLSAAEETAATTQDDSAELSALRAELEAKTTLIHTLRTDAERAEQLEQRLDEKRTAIAKLEASLDSQAKTIAELKQSVSRWKDKYSGKKTAGDTGTTSKHTAPHQPITDSGDDEEDDPEAQAATDVIAERTLAINMRDALRAARKTQEEGDKMQDEGNEKARAGEG